MKQLRKAIRTIILESQENEDKIIKLLLKDGPHMKQAISLGETLGIIRQYKDSTGVDRPLTTDLPHEVLAVFVCDRTFLDRMYKIAGYGFDPATGDSGTGNPDEVLVSMTVPKQRIDMDQMRRGI